MYVNIYTYIYIHIYKYASSCGASLSPPPANSARAYAPAEEGGVSYERGTPVALPQRVARSSGMTCLAVERTWHMQDSEGQIMALSCR